MIAMMYMSVLLYQREIRSQSEKRVYLAALLAVLYSSLAAISIPYRGRCVTGNTSATSETRLFLLLYTSVTVIPRRCIESCIALYPCRMLMTTVGTVQGVGDFVRWHTICFLSSTKLTHQCDEPT